MGLRADLQEPEIPKSLLARPPGEPVEIADQFRHPHPADFMRLDAVRIVLIQRDDLEPLLFPAAARLAPGALQILGDQVRRKFLQPGEFLETGHCQPGGGM